ncbi:MAG: ribosome maturation factor RimP [Nitrospirota bacterium]
MSDTVKEIQERLNPILESLGLLLWDIEFQKQGPKWLLRIYIDREAGGVTLDDCEAVSKDLSMILDIEDVITHAYTLEISSPGLDRSLSKPDHFTRFTGSKIKIKTYEPINDQKVFRAKLLGIHEGKVRIELDNGNSLDILLSKIAQASLEVKL